MFSNWVAKYLYAVKDDQIPSQLTCAGSEYKIKSILKHDFFAATILYQITDNNDSARQVILKLSRKQPFIFIPLFWLGRILCNHETKILNQISDIENIPHIISTYENFGFIYEYIPGKSLDLKPEIEPDFFEKLKELLDSIHEHDIAYLDMNKKGNIIAGCDGEPYIIDFQISVKLAPKFLMSRRLGNYFARMLKQADIYHLYKHKRRLIPDRLTLEQLEISTSPCSWIRAHRMAANPIRKLRRSFLRHLYKKGALVNDANTELTPENDPARFGN